MNRICALSLRESDRLMWRNTLTSLYRDKGTWEVYTFPPVIIMDTADFESHVDIKDGRFTFSGEPSKMGDFWVFRSKGSPYGLFVSKGEGKPELNLEEITVKANSLYLIEYDSSCYRVIRQRRLRTDRDL